jgi:hypothetical protein
MPSSPTTATSPRTRARGGIRTDPDRNRPEARRARLEPHGRRPALGQAPARQGRAGGHAADGGLEREPPIADEGKLWDIVDALVEIAEGKGISAARVALAWLLGRPGVTSLIVGGRTEAQFKDNLASAEVKLTAEERGRLDKISQPTLLYPYWHQAQAASDRLGAADLALLAPYLKR